MTAPRYDRPVAAARKAPTTSNLGCLLVALTVVAVLGGAVFLVVAKDRADDAKPAAKLPPRTRLAYNEIGFSMYGKPNPSRLNVDPPWQVTHELVYYGKGWSERVAFYAPPDGTQPATDAVRNLGNQFGFTITGLRELTTGGMRATDDIVLASTYRGDVNTAVGTNVPGLEADEVYHTELFVGALQGDRTIMTIQLTWTDGHEPPEGELDRVRRSVRLGP